VEVSHQKVRIWTKDFILLLLITTLSMTAITTQMGTLPLLVAQIGGSKATSGAIVGVLGIAALFVRFPIGLMLDKYGRKILLLIGLLILVIDFTLLNFLQTLLSLFLLRLVQGVGNSVQATASATMTADLIPKEKLSMGLGYFSIAQSVPSAIGPLIGLTVVQNYGFESLFRVALVLTIIAFILSLFVNESLLVRETIPQTEVDTSLLKNPGVIFPSLIMFMIYLAQAGVVAFIAQLALERGILGAGYYFTLMSLVSVTVRLCFSSILFRLKRSLVIHVSIFFIIIAYGNIVFASSIIYLLISAILFGIGIANLMPLMNTIVLQSVSDSQTGKATAIFMLSLDVAYGGGAVIWGIIASVFGFEWMYFFCAMSGVIAWLIYFFSSEKD
jgi:MFS family permease